MKNIFYRHLLAGTLGSHSQTEHVISKGDLNSKVFFLRDRNKSTSGKQILISILGLNKVKISPPQISYDYLKGLIAVSSQVHSLAMLS